jgi:hypothetical protein
MWMLNYPFPYDQPEVAQGFAALRDRLVNAVSEPDPGKFAELARQYAHARRQFFARLVPDDAKYLEFQLWQEGIARYTEILAAEAAANYQPSAEYAALADFTPFSAYAAQQRAATLDELKRASLSEQKRVVVYSFGAAEGLLLDRFRPEWKRSYLAAPFALGPLFAD